MPGGLNAAYGRSVVILSGISLGFIVKRLFLIPSIGTCVLKPRPPGTYSGNSHAAPSLVAADERLACTRLQAQRTGYLLNVLKLLFLLFPIFTASLFRAGGVVLWRYMAVVSPDWNIGESAVPQSFHGGNGLTLEFAFAGMLALALSIPQVILLKWILVGRAKPGEYHNTTYVRFVRWFVGYLCYLPMLTMLPFRWV